MERARRHGPPLAVLLLDIDHFKAINDRRGHLAGDFVLKSLATRLKGLTRKDELLARYGGEEFALVLPECELEAAFACGERVRRAVSDEPFDCDGEPYPVTVSVGVGVLSVGERVAVADLLKRADERLYEAKRTGRNRVAPDPRAGSPANGPA